VATFMEKPVVRKQTTHIFHISRGSISRYILYIYIYLLLNAIGFMPGGSVYKDHTFKNETANLTKTAQYIARIFTVQYKYMNITKHKKQKIQKKHRKCMKPP
jgi:hypothetical protein